MSAFGAVTRLVSHAMQLPLRPVKGAVASAGRLERRARAGVARFAGQAVLTVIDAVIASPTRIAPSTTSGEPAR